MKKDFTKDFKEITDMCSKIRTMNESIQFADEYNEQDYPDFEENKNADVERVQQMGGMDVDPEEQEIQNELDDPNSAVNKIREIALKGMVRLCHTPEDPQYDVLKKVFSLIDKANDKKNEENK